MSELTDDVVRAYVAILEKQVAQMTTILNNLEQTSEKLEKLEQFCIANQNCEDIAEQVKLQLSQHIKEFNDNRDKIIDNIKQLQQETYKTQESVLKVQLTTLESGLSNKLSEIKSSMKVDRAINAAGWSTFIITLLVTVFKLFGK